MTLAQFNACIDGWNRLHGGNKVEPPTEEEFDAMKAAHVEIERKMAEKKMAERAANANR